MKQVLLFGTAIFALFISSCSSQNRDYLPTSVVEDAVEEQMKLNMLDQSYTSLQTGYFECNEKSTRITLAKLAAAGVIEYKVERFAWWKKHLYAGNSYGSYYGGESYKFEEHFMVSVQLTEEGKKLVVDSIPTPEKLEDEALAMPDVDSTAWPEKNYVVENWPVIPCPEKKNDDKIVENLADSVKAAVEKLEERSNVSNIFEPNLPEEEPYTEQSSWVSLDVETETKYVAAKEKIKTEPVILKSSALEVADVRYIQTYVMQNSSISMAKAEVIVKTKDVTPAGRIIDHKCEGTKLCTLVNFMYYDDKGWVLLDKDFKFSPTSIVWESLNSQKPGDFMFGDTKKEELDAAKEQLGSTGEEAESAALYNDDFFEENKY